MCIKLEDLSFDLPSHLIAQWPLLNREDARLLVFLKKEDKIIHTVFKNIPDFFKKGDILIFNSSGVAKRRLFGRRKTGGKVEIFILEKENENFICLLRPKRRLKNGEEIILPQNRICKILDVNKGVVHFNFEDVEEFLERYAQLPLPPYIKREPQNLDEEYYQTVFFEDKSSCASSTAGLHFTHSLINKLKQKGVEIYYVKLHMNFASFRLLKEEDLKKDTWLKEYYQIPHNLIERLKHKYNRLIACGTSVVRALESFALNGEIEGYTELFIKPGFKFKLVDSLITNFHHPFSSHLLLVASFCGLKKLKEIYKQAILEEYRFLSYGDAMFIVEVEN